MRIAPALLAALLPAVALGQGSTITVTSLADSGPGTLRAAIETAFGDGGPTTIGFDPGLAGGVIHLASDFPVLTHEDETTIDGDLGGDCIPDIGLDGSALASGSPLVIWSSGNHVRGLAIFGFPSCGQGDGLILRGVAATGNVVECNWFGLDLSGNAYPTNCFGIHVTAGASDNRIGPGNRITGASIGLFIDETQNAGYPEFSGLTADLVEVVTPIDLTDDCSFFRRQGGATFYDSGGHPFSENIGVRLTGTLNIGATGNYTLTLPQLDDQARLTIDSSVLVDWNGGGTPPPMDLGLNAGSHSLRLDYLEGGGFATLKLDISGPGTVALSTDGNTAGCATGQVGLCGELFQVRLPSERNRITQNSIWNNSQQGIAFNCCCGPTANDPGDLDVGSNTVLNTPVIESVTFSGTPGNYLVSGTAPPSSTVELFAAWMNPTYTRGEGQELLGTLTSDAGGLFSGAIPIPLWKNHMVATATDGDGNSSEFSPPFPVTDNMDEVTVGAGSALPDATLEVPIYVRDQSLTLLGRDRAAGERIQGLAFKVAWTPPSTVTAAHFERAGITAALTPDFENNTQSGNTASYVAFFVESTNLIPFTLDAPAPGDQVAKLVLTLAPGASAGELSLTLDPLTTLENQAGTIEETQPSGTLTLTAGAVTVESNAASQLLAMPESSSSIRLNWSDPNRNEIGFRVERSSDGASWAQVGTVGPDDTTFLDLPLPPATLFFYRLVTLVTGGDSHLTPNAAGSTYAAVAAKVCPSRFSGPRTSVQHTAVAWNGSEWGAVYGEVTDGYQYDLRFHRLAAADLTEVGAPVPIEATEVLSQYQALRWNGAHYGLLWWSAMRTEPGPEVGAARPFFTLLNSDGSKVRGDVPLPVPYGGRFPTNLDHAFGWDGTHWGFFNSTPTLWPYNKLTYYRLDEDGDVVLGPVDITTTTDRWDLDQAAAFAPGPGVWGLAWSRSLNGSAEVWFQRVEESDGALVGAPVSLGTWSGTTDGLAIAWEPTTPPGGAWTVVWTEYAADESEAPLLLRKVAADGSPLGTAPTRLSDDANPDDPKYDEAPILAVTGTGEARAFTWSYHVPTGRYELGMLRADADGNRLGSRAFLTPLDNLAIQYPHVASNGSEQAVLFRNTTTAWMELAGVRVDASGSAGPLVWLTANHTAGVASLPPTGLAPLGSGFVALWSDRLSSDPADLAKIYGHIVDGSGATVVDLAPLTSTPISGQPALITVGTELAVAWRDAVSPGGVIRFARYDAAGNPLSGEAVVATGTNTPVVLGFDGERYGVVYRKGGSWRFVSVWPDGTISGSERTLYSPATNQTPVLLWVGSGWALVWLNWPDSAVTFGLFDRDGLYPGPATPLTGPAVASGRNPLTAAFNGGHILVAWAENLGIDPPGNDIYFAMFGRGGEIFVPPTITAGSEYSEIQPRVLWENGTFHLAYAGGYGGWVHEIQIDGAGTILPGTLWWTDRGSPAAFAGNGATRALVWGMGELHLETAVCLADATPPPCPQLAAASLNRQVRLNWSTVTDPDSGIWRHHLYRDGRMLAELYATTTQFDDSGTFPTTTHFYELRALNGAYMESEACPALSYSTWRGDANGNGTVEIGDIFYLINFMLAAGAPPAGDADANGSGGVTVGDIFYLINFFYGGGPPPAWSGETKWVEASAVLAERPAIASSTDRLNDEATESKHPVSQLAIGQAKARPGSFITVPIVLFDASGTPLGEDRPNGDRLQALAMGVRVLPASAVTRIEIRRAGMLAGLSPLFESTPAALDGAGLVVTFDEASTPLSWTTPRIRLRNGGVLIAEVVLTLVDSAATIPGNRIELRLDPATTLFSNQAGTLTESAANGFLRLVDGAVEVLP